MIRRPAVAVVLLCMLPLSAFATELPITIDGMTVLSRMAYGGAGLLGAGVLWLGKRGLESLSRVEERVNHSSQQLSTISHELFGVGGNNGMRSELKETRQLVQRHSEVLVVLADRADIAFNKDAK